MPVSGSISSLHIDFALTLPLNTIHYIYIVTYYRVSRMGNSGKVLNNPVKAMELRLKSAHHNSGGKGIYFHKVRSYLGRLSKHEMSKSEMLLTYGIIATLIGYGGSSLYKSNKTVKKIADIAIEPLSELAEEIDHIYDQFAGIGVYSPASQKSGALGNSIFSNSSNGSRNYDKFLKKSAPVETKTEPKNQDSDGDLKFFGNESFHREFWKNATGDPLSDKTYEEAGQWALDELKKTPDFLIENMPVYDFVLKYLREMHESPEGSDPGGLHKPGIEYFPSISPEVMIHLAVHESGLDNDYADKVSSRERNYREWKYRHEEFATRLQVEWIAARYNLTAEEKERRFKSAVEPYESILNGSG